MSQGNEVDAELYTPGRRLREIARHHPDRCALIVAGKDGSADRLSFAELDRWSNAAARRLQRAGVESGSLVAIHLPNCVEHVVATLAAYKLGACPMPLSARLPAAERDRLLALAQPAAILSDDELPQSISRVALRRLASGDLQPLPDRVPPLLKAIPSGGSTGNPKLIVTPIAFNFPLRGHPYIELLGLREGELMYAPGPLYHNQAFFFGQMSLFAGGGVLLNERFDARQALSLIEQHRPGMLNVVPTMMQRMLREPDIAQRDLSSIRVLWHMAAHCPAWAKRTWIDLLGPETVWELWGATESVGVTTIDGSTWLKKPGSVGRGYHTQFKIVDAVGAEVPRGEIGEIYSRMLGAAPKYVYRGCDPAPSIGDNYTSVGDLGYLDEDDYLYLVERRIDLIISGGANVYPAEVESMLSEHPAVRDVAVVGLAHEDLGRSVHAVVEPADISHPPSREDLDAFVRTRVAAYKAPRSYEFVARLPRDEAGKIRRRVLIEDRTAAGADDISKDFIACAP